MSSSQQFVPSSPIEGRRQKSRFTYKHLSLLSQSSVTCPLRVIALIDYDAFYAQCEMVRLGVSEDQPLAVQQWQGLIAINYPARDFGLNRHVTITEARSKCPQIMVQHVATWREGDDTWAYRDDAAKHIHTDKVSLDPYRLESRKSLALIKDILPAPPIQRVEKASIDEVFLDLSAQIHSILLERHPELRHAPYDDPTEQLPLPSTTNLDWQADALIDLDAAETEDDNPDWDDVVMNIGSEIVRDVRKVIKEELKYTCSAGIARNKMMAKLGAGYRKPNQQTIVRNRAVQQFLSGFKFTKIRNLGGKLGDQVKEAFNTEKVTELLEVPLNQLKNKFGDETGTWIHGVIRGEDNSEVNSRTQIKSMLSAKSFRPSINDFEQAVKWLRIFVADIYARLVEEGVVENRRRPKTMNLHHRQGATTRSKQIPISSGKRIDFEVLLTLAKNLLGQVIVDGRAWPCANLSLSVGGFEDGVSGNKGIGTFLLKGDDAKISDTPSRSGTSTPIPEDVRPQKRAKLSSERSIDHFFEAGEEAGEYEMNQPAVHTDQTSIAEPDIAKIKEDADIRTFFCSKCQKSLPLQQQGEHEDWHFAKDLQAEERPAPVTIPASSGTHDKVKKGHATPRPKAQKAEKGQSRLHFG